MYVKSKKYINLYLKEKKSGLAFYTRLWYPPKQNSIYIKLGDESEKFSEDLAYKKLQFIKEKFNNKEYNYQEFLKNYGKEKIVAESLTLNEVAEKYFSFVRGRIKTDFLDNYKERFNIKDVKDLENNQVLKKKLKSFKSFEQYYINHFKVKEWELKQEYTREKKPKQKLTKVGIKQLYKIPEKKIEDITIVEIYEMITLIKENINISQKTKHNLISMLKTIFIFAKKQQYIKINFFEDIESKNITKNPHNYRKRILDIWEIEELFKELYKYSYFFNKHNAFLCALLGLGTGARANSILNIRKSDFKFKEDMSYHSFIDAYYSIELINFKTQNKYELPLPEKIGKYFYYLLKDYKDEEYIVRHTHEEKRIIKPFAELPKEFIEACKRTINANSLIKELYIWVDEDSLKIEQLKEISHLINVEDKIRKHKEQIRKNLKSIEEERAKQYENHGVYLLKNFSFHNFRHQLVSLTSVINPLYAKRILNHSSDRKDAITDKYIKTQIEEIKEVIEKALNPYLNFLDEIIKKIQIKLKTNIHNERENFKFVKFESKELEGGRTNKNSFELYTNEYILFKIIEDTEINEDERARALNDFELFGEFDKKYLDEKSKHFFDDENYLEIENEKWKN